MSWSVCGVSWFGGRVGGGASPSQAGLSLHTALPHPQQLHKARGLKGVIWPYLLKHPQLRQIIIINESREESRIQEHLVGAQHLVCPRPGLCVFPRLLTTAQVPGTIIMSISHMRKLRRKT